VSTDYVYDSINRLVSETKTAGGGSASTVHYSYDLAGNRTEVIKNGSTNIYTLGTGNRLTSWGTNGSAQYDAAGNTTNLIFNNGSQYTLNWDSRYRLKSVKSAQSVEVTYTYDVSGRRTTRTQNGTTTRFIYNANQIVADLDASGNLLRTYTWGTGIDNLLALTTYSTTATNTYYPIKDQLGTILAMVDSTGNIIEKYEFDAFGKLLGVYDENGNVLTKSAIGNRYLFQGREYNYTTGLYYFRARYYNPITGTWLSKDPIGISGGFNLYAFCENNPVNFVDPMGLRWLGGADDGIQVGRAGTIISDKRGGAGEWLEVHIPAMETMGKIHDPLVGSLTPDLGDGKFASGVEWSIDLVVNVPTMPIAYTGALVYETGNSIIKGVGAVAKGVGTVAKGIGAVAKGVGSIYNFFFKKKDKGEGKCK